jgi:hypothetical protein
VYTKSKGDEMGNPKEEVKKKFLEYLEDSKKRKTNHKKWVLKDLKTSRNFSNGQKD